MAFNVFLKFYWDPSFLFHFCSKLFFFDNFQKIYLKKEKVCEGKLGWGLERGDDESGEVLFIKILISLFFVSREVWKNNFNINIT